MIGARPASRRFEALMSTTHDSRIVSLTVSVTEAAELLGVGRTLAYDLVARGVLPSVRLGRRVVIPRHALDELLAVVPADIVPADMVVAGTNAGR